VRGAIGSSFVYPIANHARFEHSLGVCELPPRALDTLRVQEDEARTE
jgi:HD superfamily phosphohydrolase